MTTTTINHRLRAPSILILGTLSGIICFIFLWASYRLSILLARWLSADRGQLSLPRAWAEQIEPVKWIGGLMVVLISVLVTHAWDRMRARYQLDVAQYWTMIGLALSICLGAALLSGGF
jgi:hypothetical protein